MSLREYESLNQDLFSFNADIELQRNAPLADRMRPKDINEFVGQGSIIAEGRLLRRAIASDRIGNLIFYGPPGVGKTTLAKIIASHTRAHFSILNAVLAGVKDLRVEVNAAKERLSRHGLRTILFVDEVHRFNSSQQDALLPWVENGTLILIGATTENPYFEVNKALVSRSRIFRLKALESEDLYAILNRALSDPERGFGNRNVQLTSSAANHLVDISNGDARSLLNALELAVESTIPNKKGQIYIDLEIAEESIQERAVLYDKQGDAHFDTISAFIKSLRGSDPDAALFWLARMVEAGENPRYIFRRMLIAAAEDIGLADPQAIVVVEACAAAFERVGLPEGLYHLSQASLYLASADKSNSLSGFFAAQKAIKSSQNQLIPSHLRDSHRDGNAFGDGLDYLYPHAYADNWVAQQYLPDEMQGEIFWRPGDKGWEGERKTQMLSRRAAQFAAISESCKENPFLMTTGPALPLVESWIQRQLVQEEERLHQLLERLWKDICWQRHHRVIMIECSSLFWAIRPLKEVPEGGVTILAKSKSDCEHFSAQVEILDPLLRPNIICNNPELSKELSENYKFELIGGRLYSDDLIKDNISELWKLITNKCLPDTTLRLLITHIGLAPVMSISKFMKDHKIDVKGQELLREIIELEKSWLYSRRKEVEFGELLQSLGWELQWEEWEENLSLKIDKELEKRWLSETSPYYMMILKDAPKGSKKYLQDLIINLNGQKLPQVLIHQRISAKRIL